MKTTEKQLDPCRYEVSVKVPGDDVTGYIAKGYDLLMRLTKTRAVKGETSQETITKLAGRDQADDMVNELIMESLVPFVVGGRYDTIVAPQCFTEDQAHGGRDFTYQMIVHVKPDCALSSYDPVTVHMPPMEVSPEELEQQISFILEQAATEKDGIRAVPTLTDAWVRDNIHGCQTIPEFKERLLTDMKTMRTKEAEYELTSRCCEELAGRLEADITDEVYLLSCQEMERSFETNLIQQGHSLDGYLQQAGLSLERFEKSLASQSRSQLRQGLALDALADHLGIVEVSQKDLEGFFRSITPGQEVETQTRYEDEGRLYVVRETIRRTKARRWLREHAKIVSE